MLAATPTPTPAPGGFVEGKLAIGAQRGADLADDVPAPGNTSAVGEHALVIRSRAGAAELKEIKTDEQGQYRVALPAGDYVLELKDSRARHASPRAPAIQRAFTVTANETVRVDMQVPVDIREMR